MQESGLGWVLLVLVVYGHQEYRDKEQEPQPRRNHSSFGTSGWLRRRRSRITKQKRPILNSHKMKQYTAGFLTQQPKGAAGE
jgi:hypothetical protein